jgi:hypothetical protein
MIKINEIKDILVSKKVENFPDTIKSVIITGTIDVDGSDYPLGGVVLNFDPPSSDNFIAYDTISEEQLIEWALTKLQLREQEIYSRITKTPYIPPAPAK